MKMYQEPVATVLYLEAEDVISTSTIEMPEEDL